jgi:hypothetical protein
MNAVANKMIFVIVCLSVLIAAGSLLIFVTLAGNDGSVVFSSIMGVSTDSRVSDTIPFAVGTALAAGLNVTKVLLMKRAVNAAVTRDEHSANMYLKGQYFLRLIITAFVLFLAGWFHANVRDPVTGNPQYINFMGAFFGIFTFPVSTYSMRFFFRNELKDNPELYTTVTENTVQDAIDKLNAIGEDDITTLGESNEEE